MIRARESGDRYAMAAHSILDEARADDSISKGHINWALAYLGDRASTAKMPLDLGYAVGAAMPVTQHRPWGAA